MAHDGIPDKIIPYNVFLRPHARKMLKVLSMNFELGLFTSSSFSYMAAMVKLLDPELEYFDPNLLLNRNHLSKQVSSKQGIKDLYILLENRSMMNIIMVDNSEHANFLNFENLIPIMDYYGDSEDLTLLNLTQYLFSFVGKKDVRAAIIKDFGVTDIRQIKKAYRESSHKPGHSISFRHDY